MSRDPAETFQARLRADLRIAMQARQSAAVRVIRGLLAAVDNAQAVPVGDLHQTYVVRAFGDASVEVPRRTLSDADLEALVSRESKALRAAAQEMRDFGQVDRAEALAGEAEIVERYLPGGVEPVSSTKV